MSSRVLRKLGLQGEREPNLGDDPGSETEADLSTSNPKKKQLNINRYDLLNQLSHSESEVKEDDDHETAGSMNAHEGAIDVKDTARRKKKKKKKKPCKATSNTRSSEDNVEDEVEKSVREVNALLGEVQGEPLRNADVQIPTSARKGVLSVDHRMLNPNNELRRIFGAKIVQSDQMKKRGRGTRGHLRTTYLVSPKDFWYQMGKPGLSMKLVETKNGVQYFSYEHSLSYQEIQIKFLDAVESLNPDYIMSIIHSHPYHVDALLQLSDLCKLSEDLTMATELVQRALYCLECAFHPSFSVATGNCRLDYRKQENRSFYIALFKHMMYIGSRACYRTSLEFCKVILSLDPEGDPLAVVLVMDFFALRSQEYKWLIRMANEWEATRNLSQLPNIAYSLAIAHFHLGEMSTADEMLQKAIMMFPGVIVPMAEKCSVQLDPKISSSQFFATASSLDRQSKSLTQLESLYVARSYHVWKEPELAPWLDANLRKVLEKVEADDPFVSEWAKNRKSKYPWAPTNVLRHIILSDIKDPLLTSEDLQVPVFNYDPLPPADSINLYTRPVRPRAYENDSALSIFIRSLMPNFNINQVASDEAPDEGGDESNVDLRRSVVSLLDAMRDLLSNIHLPDIPGDGDAEDDPDTD